MIIDHRIKTFWRTLNILCNWLCCDRDSSLRMSIYNSRAAAAPSTKQKHNNLFMRSWYSGPNFVEVFGLGAFRTQPRHFCTRVSTILYIISTYNNNNNNNFIIKSDSDAWGSLPINRRHLSVSFKGFTYAI